MNQKNQMIQRKLKDPEETEAMVGGSTNQELGS